MIKIRRVRIVDQRRMNIDVEQRIVDDFEEYKKEKEEQKRAKEEERIKALERKKKETLIGYENPKVMSICVKNNEEAVLYCVKNDEESQEEENEETSENEEDEQEASDVKENEENELKKTERVLDDLAAHDDSQPREQVSQEAVGLFAERVLDDLAAYDESQPRERVSHEPVGLFAEKKQSIVCDSQIDMIITKPSGSENLSTTCETSRPCMCEEYEEYEEVLMRERKRDNETMKEEREVGLKGNCDIVCDAISQNEQDELIAHQMLMHMTPIFDPGGDISDSNESMDMPLDVARDVVKIGTELHIALRLGNAKSVKYLMRRGADITIANPKQCTALDLPRHGGYLDSEMEEEEKEFDQIIESQQSVEKDELDHEEVNMYYEGGCFEIGRMFDSLKAKRNDIDSGMDRLSYNTKEMIARAKWKEERAVGMKQYVKRKIKQRQKAVLIKANNVSIEDEFREYLVDDFNRMRAYHSEPQTSQKAVLIKANNVSIEDEFREYLVDDFNRMRAYHSEPQTSQMSGDIPSKDTDLIEINVGKEAIKFTPNGNIVGTFTTDKRLMAYIAICMRIGVVLLYIPVFIGNYTSTYKNESLDQIDTPINLRDQELNGQQLCDVFDVVKYDQIRLSGEMNGLKADMILITDKRMVINDGLIEQRDDMNKQGMMQMTVDVAKGEGICNLDNDLCEFECKVDANNVAQQTESMASYHVAQQAEFMVSLPQIKTTLLPRIETESYLSSGVELHMFCGEKYDANGPATHKGRASAIGS
eukprot:287659_1